MRHRRITLAAVIPLMLTLLTIFASRTLRINELELHGDEIWTVWQTFGDLGDVVAWSPYDWGPLHFVVIWGWRALVGIHPVVLRLSSILVFMLGAAIMYRMGHDWWGKKAGITTLIAYSGLGYSLFTSLEVRGYTLLLNGLVLILWLTARYFERPSLRRAIPLAASLAALFYIQSTAVLAYALVGIFALLNWPRTVWRGWLPGILVGLLILPRLAGRFEADSGRLLAYNAGALNPVPTFLQELWVFLTGPLALIWLGLLIAGVGLAARTQSPLRRRWLVVAITLAISTLLYYFLTPVFNAATHRHAWSLLPVLALVIAYGLAQLPRRFYPATIAGVLAMLVAPLPMNIYYGQPWPNPPTSVSFQWLTRHWRAGDALLIDPNFPCYDTPMEWEYFTRVYFPNGLEYVNSPEEYTRIWYVAHDSHQDPDLLARLTANHVPGKFVGPPECLFRLYEAPPDPEGIRYENGLRFHGMQLVDREGDPLLHEGYRPFPLHEGETFRIRLWWSTDAPLPADYSFGLHIPASDGSTLLTQSDSAPQLVEGPPETSQWEAGRLYVEERAITLPYPIRTDHIGTADFTLYLVVYQWWDNTRITAPGLDQDARLPLLAIQVKAW